MEQSTARTGILSLSFSNLQEMFNTYRDHALDVHIRKSGFWKSPEPVVELLTTQLHTLWNSLRLAHLDSLRLACSSAYCNDNGAGYVDDGEGICSCKCYERFAGSRCNECSDKLVDYPICSTCSDEEYCNSRGLAELQSGQCTCQCSPGYAGKHCGVCAKGFGRVGVNCHHCTDYFCMGSGTASIKNDHCECTCFEGRAGYRCQLCAPGYFNPLQCEKATHEQLPNWIGPYRHESVQLPSLSRECGHPGGCSSPLVVAPRAHADFILQAGP